MALHSGYKPDEHPNSTQLKHHSHLEFPDSPVIDQYKCNKAGREFAQWICLILTILKALNPTTTHSFMAALHILKALNPTTTHSFMAALHISLFLNPTTTHSFVAALQISKALNPTTTHSFMAALHISMSLLIPSGLNSHVDIQISIELKQQNR